MSDIAIKAENVGKLYRLGQIGTGTISHDLNRWWAKMRGREDPFAKIGETNDRTTKGESEYVWALKDVNFEIKKGGVIGIIGRNGAGKSTLLKLLSKVTKPTTGSIYVNDRIASLLEVGTGFHPEMTGRENIYLNGAILGMTKREISRKFDEIVDFSSVERYIDTPVKRYSSGMYVRLAFAVAAHLDSEILIIDEVLAVGDAEFQDKAIGKVQNVSNKEGRTVLFVSHNMHSVVSLCRECLLMENGSIKAFGKVDNIISQYLAIKEAGLEYKNKDSNGELYLANASIYFETNTTLILTCQINSSINTRCSLDLRVKTKDGIPFGFGSIGSFNNNELLDIKNGSNNIKLQINVDDWALGKYFFSIDITQPDVKYYERLENILMFEIVRGIGNDRRNLSLDWNYGPLHLQIKKV